MATPPEAVRGQLAVITATAAADLAAEAARAPADGRLNTLLDAIRLVVPTYYNAAGVLAVAWYDELRDAANPSSVYVPDVIGDPTTDWIEREIAKFAAELEGDLDIEAQRLADEAIALADKEIARGFRDSIIGNTRIDSDAIGWSRVVRPGACKFCLMLADKGSVYHSESTAIFAAHIRCNCAARPEFRGGDHGPEANVVQYVASSKRARSEKAQAARNARVRAYLNENYPEAPG
jgi:hypothetical protein